MQVNVSEEEDDFQLVITACLSVLILGTETKLDAALVQMTRLPWASLETVRAQRAHARQSLQSPVMPQDARLPP